MLLGVLFATGPLFFVAGAALGQDPVKVSPETHKVLLENDRVRVVDVRIKPGEKVPMHSHPAQVFYRASNYKIRSTSPDGKTEEYEGKAGEAVWREPLSHAVENVGTTELHVVHIELKGAATKPAPAGTALADDVVKVAPDSHKVLLENDQVRVLDVRSKPGQKAAMHLHPANVVYFLTDAKFKFTYPDGKSEERESKAGQARWSEAVTHAAGNVGTADVHLVQIELKGAAASAKK
jgi:quercetin dioxygenase-like cupin family protein